MPILLYKTTKANRAFEKNKYSFGEIYSENILIQRIRFETQENIKAIELYLANYGRNNTNSNEITIYNNNEIFYKKRVNSHFLDDNAFYRISNLNIPVNIGEEISLSISSDDGEPGNAITAWIDNRETNNHLFKYRLSTGSYIPKSGELSMRIFVAGNLQKYLSERYIQIPVVVLYLLYGLLCLLILSMFWIIIS